MRAGYSCWLGLLRSIPRLLARGTYMTFCTAFGQWIHDSKAGARRIAERYGLDRLSSAVLRPMPAPVHQVLDEVPCSDHHSRPEQSAAHSSVIIMRPKWIGCSMSLSSLILLSGCLVIPGSEQSPTNPIVEGVILESGQPVAGRGVSVIFSTRQTACQQSESIATTDHNGQFRTTPELERSGVRVLTFAPSSPTFFVSVCVEGASGSMRLFDGRYRGAPPTSIALVCDLVRQRREQEPCESAVTPDPFHLTTYSKNGEEP